MKNWKFAKLLNTPLGVVIVVGLLILGVEFLIMLVIVSMHNVILYDQVMEEIVAGIIDPILLTLIVSPVLYFLVFRKIQEGEERFRQINSSAQDAIVIVNEQVQITDWNFAAKKMFQYSREEAVGQQMHQLIAPPRYHADAARGFARFQETGAGPLIGKTTEITALRKDGSEFPIELSISAVKVKGRWHAMGVMRDITERRQAEQVLQESESKYRRLIENSPDIAYTFSVKRGGIYYSFQVVAILGYSVEQLYANPFLWNESIHPEDRAVVAKAIEEFKTGAPFKIEYRIKNARGEWCWFFDRSIGSREENGDSIIEGLAMDITERKQTEFILKFLAEGDYKHRDENFFQALAEFLAQTLAMDYVCIDRLEGDNLSARTLVIYSDGKFEDNVSYTLKDTPCGDVVAKKVCCFSKDVRHLFPQDAVLQEILAESYVGTTLFDFTGKPIGLIAVIGRQPLANPHLAEVLLQMVAARAAAELEHQKFEGDLQKMLKAAKQSREVMLGVVEDQKRAEESLRQLNEELENKVLARTAALGQAKLEAEQASQAKSSFLAAMSHEIRTPMNGVIGMVDVLHQSSLHGYQVEMVDLIRESAYSLLGIINDILDFSKIEAGKLEIEHAPTRVADVVENVCAMLDGMAGKKGVELTLFTDPAIPAEVLGDATRLRQVLVNIVNNAIKFSGKQQGKVSVRAVLAESTPDEHGRFPLPNPPPDGEGVNESLRDVKQILLELRVTDNGIGMDEKTLSGLFTPFTQADISTTRNFGGTGLGLSIAHHLVELMGGKITVQSEPDKGSTFIVHLTFVPLPSKPDAGAAASPVTGLSCLLIGGTEGLTRDLSSYLTHDGAVVERAADMATAQTLMPTLTSGQWIWIIDAIGVPPQQDELRAVTSAHPKYETRFVIIGRGQRRKPRVKDDDVVWVDGNVLTRRILLKAVAIAAGRASVEQETPQTGKSEAEFKLPSRDDALRQGRLILVAEDNETNQKVILRQLALLGFAADIADNGRIALESWKSGDYGMLLSDLHMPEMDGYELTTAIRAAEQGTRHTPIVALTANALKGEADHCREIGMDDYLSKPAQLADLKAMLEKWMPVADVGRDLSRHASPDLVFETVGLKPDLQLPASPAPVDVNVLKALVGDDDAFIRDYLHDYRISAAKIAVELRAAAATNQTSIIGALAHNLKSTSRSAGALALGELCAAMEQAGKAGDSETLTAMLPMFEQELASVDRFLDGY